MSPNDTPALCRWLRWKGYYSLEAYAPEELVEHAARNDVQWSCLLTAQSWGPDDEVCTPEGCQRDRGCFELHPRSPR